MADYFSEYSSFIGAKGLPSPADTPYETPALIRSKRSSRATTVGSRSREPSSSPPPLPPDATDFADKTREGRYSALDPRRFTPTLHASLVSEILSLRRELDSKNHLVENLETSLSAIESDNKSLSDQLSASAKSVRVARGHVQQMELGTLEALDIMAKERDAAQTTAQDLRSKLEAAQKKSRLQDDSADRAQSLWGQEKDSWENERRQLERRVHVTEARLRTFVDEMVAQQTAHEAQNGHHDETSDEGPFKDSGIGNDSDAGSIYSKPVRHGRAPSNVSFVAHSVRDSSRTALNMTPEPHAKPAGFSLADELGADDGNDSETSIYEEDHVDDELDYHDQAKRTIHSRQNSINGELESKAKRVLGLTDDVSQSPSKRTSGHPKLASEDTYNRQTEDTPKKQTEDIPKKQTEDTPKKQIEDGTTLSPLQDTPFQSPSRRTDSKRLLFDALKKHGEEVTILPPLHEIPPSEAAHTRQLGSVPRKVQYVDHGYQPSPPPSPPPPTVGTQRLLPAPDTTKQEAPIITVDQAPPSESTPNSPRQHSISIDTRKSTSPISPPETPIGDDRAWPEDRTSTSDHLYSDMSTQTESDSEPAQSHSQNRDSLQLPVLVPSIAIHPPSSRPSSPRPYALPPGTKNASTQASFKWSGQDASVQTEEIRIDKRSAKLPPHLLPAFLLQAATETAKPQVKRHSGPALAKISPQAISTPAAVPSPSLQSPTDSIREELIRNNSSKDIRSLPLKAIPLPKPTLAPAISMGDGHSNKSSQGPLNRSAQFGVTQDNRNARQLANIENESDGSEGEEAEPSFNLRGTMPGLHRPTGRFTPSEHPKAVPEDKEISPERRPTTADSFGAAPAPSVASSKDYSQRTRKRPPPKISTYANMRSPSPSLASAASSSFSAQSTMPPFPIPTRSSSRLTAVAHSEGSYSPTPESLSPRGSRRTRGNLSRQGSLRKVQSTTAIRQTARPSVRTSPRKGRRRMHSPELTPVQSMAFESSPAPTDFPIPDLPTPLQQGGTSFTRPSTAARPPDTAASSLPPAEEVRLVDAIAATMVGEWMWKYIRKRKSFGVGESTEDFTQTGGRGVGDIPGIGSRHKRWVWLSPYERTIMWDSKQPTSGNALLGKKGRKLVIQAVLDVQDDNRLPKRPELETAHHRSILVLTPSRALKFTAPNAERHHLWMTALSFLAESSHMQVQLPPLPNVPPMPRRNAPTPPLPNRKRSDSPSFGRATIRDSVRLTKSKGTPFQRSVSAQDAASTHGPDGAPLDDGAEFPAIPRLYSGTTRHQRKRSNTSPRLPQPLNNLRSLSSSAVPSTASSQQQQQQQQQQQSHPYPRLTGGASSSRPNLLAATASSHSGSRGGAGASPDRPNFFEAVGTMRMEAFVDPGLRNGVLYVPAPLPSAAATQHHAAPRRRRGDSNLSASTVEKRRAGYVFDEDGLDPFKGF